MVGLAQISLAAIDIQYPPEAATLPIDTTSGRFERWNASSSSRITSDANALPPPESTRSTSALTESSSSAWRISSASESPPIDPGGCVPSRMVPAATITATLLAFSVRLPLRTART